MATKKKGQLTTSKEWAKHLRKFWKGKFWKGKRQEQKKVMTEERVDFVNNKFDEKEWKWAD